MPDRLASIVVANPNPGSLSHAMARAAAHLEFPDQRVSEEYRDGTDKYQAPAAFGLSSC